MGMTTPTPEVDDLVQETMAEMSAVQHVRLEHYARSKGLTPDQLMVKIVEDFLAAEAVDDSH